MKKVVQYVNKVGEKFCARKKVLPFVLNPPQIGRIDARMQIVTTGHTSKTITRYVRSLLEKLQNSINIDVMHRIRRLTAHCGVLPTDIFNCTTPHSLTVNEAESFKKVAVTVFPQCLMLQTLLHCYKTQYVTATKVDFDRHALAPVHAGNKVDRIRQQSTLLPICCRFRQQSTFNKVDHLCRQCVPRLSTRTSQCFGVFSIAMATDLRWLQWKLLPTICCNDSGSASTTSELLSGSGRVSRSRSLMSTAKIGVSWRVSASIREPE